MDQVETNMSDGIIPKKGSPFYHFDFRLNGIRFYGSTERKRKSEARRFVEKMRADILSGDFAPQLVQMTVDVAFGRWITEVGDHLKERANHAARFKRLIAHFGKDTLLSEITSEQLTRYVAKYRGKRSPTTINHDLRLKRRVMRRAKNFGA